MRFTTCRGHAEVNSVVAVLAWLCFGMALCQIEPRACLLSFDVCPAAFEVVWQLLVASFLALSALSALSAFSSSGIVGSLASIASALAFFSCAFVHFFVDGFHRGCPGRGTCRQRKQVKGHRNVVLKFLNGSLHRLGDSSTSSGWKNPCAAPFTDFGEELFVGGQRYIQAAASQPSLQRVSRPKPP